MGKVQTNPILKPSTVVMGAGGAQPKANAFDVDSRQIKPLVDLEPGQSVYAIDIDFDAELVALGTRGGVIKIVTGHENAEASIFKSHTLIQGAPVLSVCWAEINILAASDNVGRCLLWDTEQENLLGRLEVAEGAICSMAAQGKDILAGISSTGALHLWHKTDKRLLRVIKGPSPPPIKALVEMVYWPAKEALAWPGQGGRLVLFQYQTEHLMQLNAHMGEFYAVSVQGDNLITTGMEDGTLKIWVPSRNESVREHKVNNGIISTAVAKTEYPFLFTVDKEGVARLHTIMKDKIDRISQIPGNGYRTLKASPWDLMQASYTRQRAVEVEEIISRIRNSNEHEENEATEALHARLVSLGYPHVSLAIRAGQAVQRGRLVEGIKWRHQLMGLIPEKAGACPSMEEYAAILENTWHLPEANAVCNRIRRIEPNYSFTLDTTNIETLAKTVIKNRCIIDADIPIEQIIGSATIIEKPFSGRYLIKELPAESSQIRLDPAAIQEKYELIRKENGHQDLPSAVIEKLVKVSRKGVQNNEYVTFGDGNACQFKGLQFIMQILGGDLGTVVRAMVLFDWRELSLGEPVEAGNELAERAFSNITNDASSSTYLSAVHRAAKFAIRRVLTQRTQKEVMFP